MPPVEALYLLGYLFEVGPVMPGGMSAGPITHCELESWQRVTGVALTAWEARTLRRLSVDYLGESHRATKIDCAAPWEAAAEVIELPNYKVLSSRDSIRALAKL